MSDLTPEERVRRVKAALAEAGWADPAVVWHPGEDAPGVSGDGGRTQSDADALVWRAFAATGELVACWPCWSTLNVADDCDHDPLTSPWPEVVR